MVTLDLVYLLIAIQIHISKTVLSMEMYPIILSMEIRLLLAMLTQLHFLIIVIYKMVLLELVVLVALRILLETTLTT